MVLEKEYGSGKQWSRRDAENALAAARRFEEWLVKNCVYVGRTTGATVRARAAEFRVVLRQPYFGADCETILGSSPDLTDASTIFRMLLHVAERVAVDPAHPVFRVEVKPRDFCLHDAKAVMVDTFPPVLARYGSRYVAAHRSLTRSCLATRDREEVLAVTGSPAGVFRNLCEHMCAIDGENASCWKAEAVAFLRTIDERLSKELARYLRTPGSQQKVLILRNRIRERNSR